MTRGGGRRPTFRSGYEWRLPLIGAFGLALLSFLFVFDQPLYRATLTWWIDKPFATPFIDLDSLLTAHTCWRQGFDVYVDTPCDVLDRPFFYSPLWLRLDFLPPGGGWPPWPGLALTVAYLAALGALPRLERGFGLVALGAVGSLPVFALERGNFDEAIVVFTIVAALLLAKGARARVIGYGLIATAAALKFYPLAAFVVAGRERLRAAATLAIVVAVGVAAFVLRYRDELREITLAPAHTFTDNIGAAILPHGVRVLLGGALQELKVDPAAIVVVVALSVSVVWVGLSASAIVFLATAASRRDFMLALRRLPVQASVMLTMAAAMFCGCFFALENVGYRAVLILPALPVLVGLTRGAPTPWTRRLFASAVAAAICGLWMLTLQQFVAFVFGGSYYPVQGSMAGYLFWVVRELAWWWVATVLAAALVRQILDGLAVRELRSLLVTAAGRIRRVASGVGKDASPMGHGARRQCGPNALAHENSEPYPGQNASSAASSNR